MDLRPVRPRANAGAALRQIDGPSSRPQSRQQSGRRQQLGIAGLYCHDNEHQRQLEAAGSGSDAGGGQAGATHSPFANLKSLLDSKKRS
jgi:hypothetical protein